MIRLSCTVLLVSATLVPCLAGQEGGIEVFAAETLFGGGSRVSLTGIYKKEDRSRSGSSTVTPTPDQKWEEFRTVLGYDYGVRPDLTLSLLVPYVHRELRIEGFPTQKADDLGDLAVLGKYKLYQEKWKGGAFNWSMVGGLELPTGGTDAFSGGVRHAPKVQAGSGSWDPVLATSVTLGSGRSRYDALLFYKFNNEGAQEYEAGDFFVASVTGGYRFINEEYPGPTVAARVGLQYRHKRRSNQGVGHDPFGNVFANSGSDELWLHLTLGAHPTPRLDLSVALDLPLYGHYNGTQLVRDYQLTFNFGVRF